jgi:multiple sugar transport system permease protein
MMIKSYKARQRFNTFLWYFFATIIAIVIAIPFYWMISTSLNTRSSLSITKIQWFPKVISMDSYKQVFETENFISSITNSFYLSILSTIIQLIFASMAAYALSIITFKGRELIFKIMIATMMIPTQVTIIPLYVIMTRIGMLDNINSLLFLQLFNILAIFILRQKMFTIKKDFIEAAIVESAGPFRIFISIVLPLCAGTLATLAVIGFMGIWNEYFIHLVLLTRPENYTLPLVLSAMRGQYDDSYNVWMAGATISIIPILILYIFMQNYFSSGLQVGGVKG